MSHRYDHFRSYYSGLNGPGSNGKEGVLIIRLFNVLFMTLVMRILPLCSEAVGEFLRPSRLDHPATRYGSLTSLQNSSQ